MKERTKTLLGLHLAVFLAGGTGLFGRYISLAEVPLVWYRVMVAVVVMAAAMALMKRLHRVPGRTFAKIAALGALLAIHWCAFYGSIKASNVSVGVVCVATSAFFTTMFDPLINKKRFSWVDFFICAITITGILLIFSLDVRYRLGIALGLLCSAVYSLFSILNIRVAAESGEDSSTMLLYELVGSVLFLTLCMPFYHMLVPSSAIVPHTGDALALLALGSIFTVIPFLLQIMALRRLSAFTVNISYNLEPVYSIFLAAILFGETRELSLAFWLGLSLVVLSVILQTVRSSRQA